LALLAASPVLAQEQEKPGQAKPQGPPPAKVVVGKSREGMVRPQTEFIGTLEFPDVSTVASEAEGRVDRVSFEEGDRVRRGQAMVSLDADLLRQDIEAAKANLERVRSDLENAGIDLARKKTLYESRTVSGSVYDDARFKAQGLENQARSLEADLKRYQIQLGKKAVYAPFNGVVLAKHTSVGEWLSPGSAVADVAMDGSVDVVVEVPQDILEFQEKGAEVEAVAAGRTLKGRIVAVIPKGDVTTRTFPVKVRVANDGSLAQGMEARVRLASGNEATAVFVPRDAVIQAFGSFVVWVVKDGAAAQVPVQVTAYTGMEAAVTGQGLGPDMDVVVKGNERLRPGQPVMTAD
jgi:RND family efflux transporter MFP subunit